MAEASLGTAVLHAKIDTSQLRVGLTRAEQEVERSARNMTQRLTGVGEAFQRIGTRMTIGLTAPLGALGAVGVRSAMQLETFSKSLTVLIGDTQRATAAFDELYEFSANTTFEWRSLTEGTRVLAAFGVEAEDLVPTLSMLGDVAAGLDTPLEDLAQIFGRVRITGRAGMEEINRLADRGVPVYTELARVMGVNESAVRDLVSAGAVGFPQIQAMFRNLTSEGGMFFGMMEAQTDTTAGRLARLKDSFEQVTDIIGDRLLPSFDRLIAAGQRATDWFVELDETTQGLFVGLGTTLAVSGPLMIGIGTLAIQLPKLAEGFKKAQLAMGPMFGPAGMLVVGVGVIAGLVAAMSGREGARKDSLVGALEDTAKAAKDVENPVGRMHDAFDELADGLRGKALQAFLATRGELAAIVTEADNAAQALLQIQLGTQLTSLFGTTFGDLNVRAALRASGASMYGADRIQGAESEVTSLLQTGRFDDAVQFLDRVVEVLQSGGAVATNALAEVQDFRELVVQARDLSNRAFQRPPPAGPVAVPPGAGTSGGRTERTWQEILKELDAAGTQAMRVAAFEGTREAAIEATQTRMRLISSAIAELMADPHYGLLPDGTLDGLRERLEAAGVELDALLAGPRGARPRSPAAVRAMEAAEVGGPSAGMSTGMTAEELRDALVDARTRLGPVATKWADYLAQELDREVQRFQAGLPTTTGRRRFLSVDPTANVGGAVAVRPPGMTANVLPAHAAPGSVFTQFSEYLDRETQRQLERMQSLDITTTNTDRAIRAERELAMQRQRAQEQARLESNQTLADFRQGEAERISALRYGGENARTYTQQVQLQAQAMSLAAREGITLTDALKQITETGRSISDVQADIAAAEERWRTAGDDAGRAAARALITSLQSELAGMEWSPTLQTIFGGVTPEYEGKFETSINAAAESFQKTVVSAGISFTDTLVRSIQSGDLGGVISGLFGGAGSIIPAIPDIGVIGTIIGGLLPIFGGLLGGLVGGGQNQELERRRAAGAATRGAPALELNLIVNQSLNVQSLTDTASRRAVDGLLDDTVRRIEDTIVRNIVPRLQRLEGAGA